MALSIDLKQFQSAVRSCEIKDEHGNVFTPTETQFTSFQAYVAESGIDSMPELAMFLAQVVHESAGLRVKEEFGKGASKSYENCCDSVHSDRSLWVERCNPTGKRGVSYHGRGYLQLTHCYNYHAASLALFGNAYTLLENPDFVLEEGIAWRTAFWFWKTIVRTDARKNDIKAGKFGVTTAAINGMECTNPDLKKIAQKRFKYYKNVSEALKLKPSTNAETGCYKC